MSPGPWFNIKMTSYQYRKSHCEDKTILRPSYLHNGIFYTGKTTSLYWIRAQFAIARINFQIPCHVVKLLHHVWSLGTCKFLLRMPWADSRFAPNHWETALLCNDVSHWHGASLKSALQASDVLLWLDLKIGHWDSSLINGCLGGICYFSWWIHRLSLYFFY